VKLDLKTSQTGTNRLPGFAVLSSELDYRGVLTSHRSQSEILLRPPAWPSARRGTVLIASVIVLEDR